EKRLTGIPLREKRLLIVCRSSYMNPSFGGPNWMGWAIFYCLEILFIQFKPILYVLEPISNCDFCYVCRSII
ncbi:MAG: hypothetical protein WB988_02460, partial [Candidatus Nitrosopolaris sp.]